MQRLTVHRSTSLTSSFPRHSNRPVSQTKLQLNSNSKVIRSAPKHGIVFPITYCVEKRSFTTTTASHNVRDNAPHHETLTFDPTDQLLELALHQVPKHGWTVESLSKAAEQLGYPGIAHGMAPNGPIDLVMYFVDKCNRQTLEKLSQIDTSKMTTKEKLFQVVKIRLEQIIPYISTWPQALSLFTNPSQVPSAVHSIAVLMDELWYQAGDRSTDFNWYTKRFALAGIYTTTELFMLSDASLNYSETWKFLERRIDDAIYVNEMTSEAQKLIQIGANGAFGLLGKGIETLFGSTSTSTTTTNTTTNENKNSSN